MMQWKRSAEAYEVYRITVWDMINQRLSCLREFEKLEDAEGFFKEVTDGDVESYSIYQVRKYSYDHDVVSDIDVIKSVVFEYIE